VKNNYGTPQGPTIQLAIFRKEKKKKKKKKAKNTEKVNG